MHDLQRAPLVVAPDAQLARDAAARRGLRFCELGEDLLDIVGVHEVGDRGDTGQVAARVFEHLECSWVEVAEAAVELEHGEQRAGVLDERAVEHRGLHGLFGHDARGDVAAPHEHVFGCRHLVEDERRRRGTRPRGRGSGRAPRRSGRRRSRTAPKFSSDDDEVGGVDEVEERRALERRRGGGRRCRRGRGHRRSGRGRRRSRTATGRAVDDGRGSSRIARLRHVEPPVVGLAALHAARNRDTTWRVRRSTRREYSPPEPEVQPRTWVNRPGWRPCLW